MPTNPTRTEPRREGPAKKLHSLLVSFQDRVDGVHRVAIGDKSGLTFSSQFAVRANVLIVTGMTMMAMQLS